MHELFANPLYAATMTAFLGIQIIMTLNVDAVGYTYLW